MCFENQAYERVISYIEFTHAQSFESTSCTAHSRVWRDVPSGELGFPMHASGPDAPVPLIFVPGVGTSPSAGGSSFDIIARVRGNMCEQP
jgi:hypothetical protein